MARSLTSVPQPSDVISPLVFVDATDPQFPRGRAIVVAVDRDGRLPEFDPHLCDVLITTAAVPAAPWVGIDPMRLDPQIETVRRAVAKAPLAAGMLIRVLRIVEQLSFDDGLAVESFAYSALLGGAELAAWLSTRAPLPTFASRPGVHYERVGEEVRLTLADPATRNAMTAAMRDALCEALETACDDPSLPLVTLVGAGRCFSTGGYLPEFGSQRDLALAHAVRMARSPARLLHRLGERGNVALHGACIGSGIEIAAAAARRTGALDTFLQLPELAMGLIPGAGGTVTLPRVIGRHRTAWLALGGFRLGARQALDWGLLHALLP